MSAPSSVFYHKQNDVFPYDNKTSYATIYFEFGKSNLNSQVIDTLNSVVRMFSTVLSRQRVSFTFMGYADHIGEDAFNVNLGQLRADAVKNYLDRSLDHFDNYSSSTAHSFGEKYAATGSPTPDQRALDRRVEVFANWEALPPKPIVTPQGTKDSITYPDINRTIERSFSKFEAENLGQPPDEGKHNFKRIVEGIPVILGDEMKKFEATWGEESKKTKRAQMIPGNYRVNTVWINMKYDTDVKGFANMQYWSAEIKYEWGLPKPVVQVTGPKTY